ncbi:helix-turn-helix domain-containing protein [Branchiibius hedensis]|nr:helix-turn-helix domain-containing protein [Branchiibius hedensis]
MRAAADLIARARAVKGDRRMVPVLVPRLRSAGLPYADIAEVLGVSVSTAWRVANRPPP